MSREYFFENDIMSGVHSQEESFILNTETGSISVEFECLAPFIDDWFQVTLHDLVRVGVDVRSNVLSIDQNQTAELLKLIQTQEQFPVQHVSNFETIDSEPKRDNDYPNKQPTDNFYAYIDDNCLFLVEDKTNKQLAKASLSPISVCHLIFLVQSRGTKATFWNCGYRENNRRRVPEGVSSCGRPNA